MRTSSGAAGSRNLAAAVALATILAFPAAAAAQAELTATGFPHGNIEVGVTDGPGSSTIENTGAAMGMDDGSFTVTDVTPVDPECDDYALTVSLPTTLMPTESLQVFSDFTPSSRGTRDCTVSITSDAPGSPHTMIITGTGEGPSLALSTELINFGSQPIADGPKSGSFMISNNGDPGYPLTITDVSVSGADFAISSGWSGSSQVLNPGESITIGVEFDPSTTGNKTGSITVVSDDPNTAQATQSVSLTGRGTSRVLATTPSTTVAIGEVVVGDTGTAQVTLDNDGEATMTVTAFSFGGTNPAQFSKTAGPNPSFTIDGNSSQTITLACTPTSSGSKTATFTITSNADNTPSKVLDLTCSGMQPDIDVTPQTPLAFGDQVVGTQSAAQQFTISNASGTYVSNLTAVVTNSNTTDFDVMVQGCSLGSNCTFTPGQSRTVTVRFSPNSLGSKSGTITITSDDPDESSIAINMSGNGVEPDITLTSASSHNFGDVEIGQTSANHTVSVRNDGSATLTISSVSLGGSNPAQFAITGGTVPGNAITLAPGASTSWTVACQPTTKGNKSAAFQIGSDDPDEGTVSVSLSCRGTEAALTATPTPLTFAVTRVGETSNASLTLENAGNVSLTVTSLSLSHNVFALVSPPSTPFTLEPNGQAGDSVSLDLTFTPVMHGDISGTLTVMADELANPASFSVVGPGRLAEVSVSPTSWNAGDVRVDQTFETEQVFTIENIGTASFQVSDITLDNGNDFQLTVVNPVPRTLDPGQTAQFRILATPDDLGMNSGMVTISTDIPTGANPTVPLEVTGIAPGIEVSDMLLDFGHKDVQDGPETLTVTVMNDGTAPLVVTDLVIDGSPNYALAPVTLPVTIMPSQSLDVDVVYDPPVANGGEPDTTLVVTSDAHPVGTINIDLMGRAVDREIDVDSGSVQFPATYRNPEEPRVVALEIRNRGLAPLELSMAIIGGPGAESFTVVEEVPIDIGAAPSDTTPAVGEITIAFAPTVASSAPLEATLVISNNDLDEPMIEVPLSGLGILPDIQVTPGDVDIGRTGVGVPLSLADEIEVINNDSDETFTVRELRVVDMDGNPMAGTFEVIGFEGPAELPASARVAFDVQFTPTTPGTFEAVVEVYMNSDPERVAFVTVRGEAVEVKLRGGGCQAGGQGGWQTLLLVALALALLGLGRRRLARAAPVGLLVLVCAVPAVADPTRNLDLSTFRPAPQVEPAMLSVETAEVGLPGAWSLGFFFDYAANPLVVESPQVPDMEDTPVSARTVAELALAYAFGGRYEAGLLVPFIQQNGDAPMFSGLEPAEGGSLGDLSLHGKMRLYAASPLALGVSATLTVPTAKDGMFAGIDGPSGHLRGILGVEVGRVRVAGNGGLRLRGTGELGDVEQGNELTYAIGASYRVTRSINAIGELYGAFGMAGGATEGVSPLEASLGVRWRVNRILDVAGGVGRGILPGIGSPDARGFVMLSFASQARPLAPLPGAPAPRPIDRGDDDDDGVINSEDECPLDAEDLDGFQDDDGCPDLDNDGDGLLDEVDPCPNEAEDMDGFQDGDGCPDLDNDGDGIPDTEDQCPDEPEDLDGFQDRDGCDDPDNDGDGIPDIIDQCALEPETINGIQDDDGCPDEGESLVMVMPDRIEVFEPIRFRRNSAEILTRSHGVLGQVAATLRANRDFLRIRIGAHVHPRGSGDDALAVERAKAVRQWLIDWGIEPERLEVKGYGSERPLVPKNQRGAAELNDRIEFVLVEKKVTDGP